MSDNDDTEDGAPVATPEASRGWSAQDRRTLIITIVGGLAANVGTVILVGAAIAFVHLNAGHPDARYVLAALGSGVFALVAIAFGIFLRRDRDYDALRVLGWALIVTGSVLILMMVLILTGLAAGVK